MSPATLRLAIKQLVLGAARVALVQSFVIATAIHCHAQAPLELSVESRTPESGQITDETSDEELPDSTMPDIEDLDALLNADLEQLAATDVVVPVFIEQVTTVSRNESTVGKSAAAIYVITNEMLRRSAVRNLPEALRLKPNRIRQTSKSSRLYRDEKDTKKSPRPWLLVARLPLPSSICGCHLAGME